LPTISSALARDDFTDNDALNRPTSNGRISGQFYRRLPALDGIRGLPSVGRLPIRRTFCADTARGLHLLASCSPGWVGVQLFFALSVPHHGILSTRNAHRNYFLAFYAKRALRFSAYYTVLILFVDRRPNLLRARPSCTRPRRRVFAVVVRSLTGRRRRRTVSHTSGSLVVEEQFYLFWPFIVQRFRRLVFQGLCLHAMIGLVTRYHGIQRRQHWRWYTGNNFALGCPRARRRRRLLLPHSGRAAWLASRLPAVNLAHLAIPCRGVQITHAYDTDSIRSEIFGYTLLALCCATLVTGAAGGGEQ